MGWSMKASIAIAGLAAFAKPADAYDCAGFKKEGGLAAVTWDISSPRKGRTDVRLTFRKDSDRDIEGVLAQALSSAIGMRETSRTCARPHLDSRTV